MFFINLIKLFSGEINAARNIGKEKKQDEEPAKVVKTPTIGDKVRFKSDVEALEAKYGKSLPAEITMTLSEALEIMPRDRKRTDAYKALQKYLSERGVNLIINSNKTQNNGSK